MTPAYPAFTPADPRADRQRQSLSNVLAGLLVASPAYHWPGGDGMLVEEVLGEYPAAAAARMVPGEIELCDRYPELMPHVVAFFYHHTPAGDRHG